MKRIGGIISILLHARSLAAGVVYVVSGSLKALDIESFAQTLALHHNRASDDLSGAAWLAVVVEIGAGLLVLACLMARRPRTACALATGMFIVFSAYAAWMMIFPPSKPAGCCCGFARELLAPDGWKWIHIRNSLVTASLAGFVALVSPRSPTSPSPLS